MAERYPGTIFVVNTLHSGGAEKQLLWIAKTLVELGPVTVVEMKETRGSSRVDRLIEETTTAGVRFARAKGGSYVRAWVKVGRELKASPRAIVWTWGLRTDVCVFLWRLIGRTRAPWVSSLRNANQHGIESSAWLYRRFVAHVTLFVANTQANCDMLSTVCAAVKSKCRVLPNVVREIGVTSALDLPVPHPQPLKLAMVGNIDIVRKGYDTAVEVAKLILVEKLPIELHIAGRPDELVWLNAEIRRHRLEPVVHYHGEIREPLEYLKQMHGFLLLSRFEGMPNALLEALCLALPSVVTAVGDLAQLAGEPLPYRVIPHGAPQQAVVAIKAMLADWPAAVAMGRHGRAWCEAHFSEAHCRRQLFAIGGELGAASTQAK